MGKQTELFLIYGLIVMYALCYQLQSPVEPFLVDKLTGGGASPESSRQYANLMSFFSFAQAFGSLIVGYFLDRFGVRAGFCLNFIACAISYYMLSIANSMEMLFLSKVPGMCLAGFLCAQTAIAKVTEQGPERLTALGRLTTASTVGGIIGPSLGGYLGASGNYTVGSTAAVVLSLLSVFVCVFLLPANIDSVDSGLTKEKKKTEAVVKEEKETDVETTKSENDCSKTQTPALSWLNRAKLILSLVWLFLFVKVVTSISNSMVRSAQPLILKNELGCNEAMLGMFMSAQFGFGGFANTFLLAPVTKLLGGDVTVVVQKCVLCMGGGYAMIAVIYSTAGDAVLPSGVIRQYPFICITMLLAIFQYCLGTCITANTTSIVPKHFQGTLMGIEHALFAVAYMVGPKAGVAVLQYGGISGLALASAGIFTLVLLIWTGWVDGAGKKVMPSEKPADEKAGEKNSKKSEAGAVDAVSLRRSPRISRTAKKMD